MAKGLDYWINEKEKERERAGLSSSSNAQKEKNKGGFRGGAEYLGTRLVDGVVSNIEGLHDLAVGGIAGLIGLGGNENAQEFAKNVIRDDWYNYERADDKYNPGPGMKVLGDIAGVVGGALPDVAIGLLTGGLGWGAKAISAGTSFASSAGRGLNEAVNTTGDLGAKEWAGGIGSGVLSAGVELVSGGLGEFAGGVFGKTGVEMGGELAESFGKKASNETIESIFKKTVGKEAAGEFGESAVGKLVNSIWNSKTFRELAGEMTSEGLEESFETILEPFIKQNTYDPDAPNATLGDIAYSGFLGAVAGGVMSGSVNTLNNAITTKRGATIANNNNKLTSLFGNAEAIINYENKNDTGSQIFGAVSNMYQDIQNKLQESGGRMTASIYNDIGKLDALVASAVMQPSVVNAAKGVAQNAESMAEQLNSFYKKTGQNKTVTAEQLTKGLKLDGSSKDFVKSVTDALNTNATLREVVINNMLGRLDFDAKVYANSIYGDTDIRSIATQQNINRFLGSADAATLGQTGEVLGISDWASLTPQELAEKIQQFRRNGGEEAFAEGISSIMEAQKAKGYTNGMPGDISALKQGATRFKVGEADFAIIRHGDSYRLYDYNTGHITKSVQMGDMNSLVARLRERAAQVGRESEMQALDHELDNFAMENVPEYKSLTAAEKEAVRATLRYAQASGISMKDQILFARIAAKSGMNIITVKGLLDNKAAWYDGMNTVYIDSTSPRTRVFSGILGHELYHKMFKSDKRRKLFNSALQNIDQTLKDKTKAEYKEELRKLNRYTEQEIEAISDEEVAAAYAEKLFNTPDVWSYILDGEPNLSERVINFFKGSPKRYDFAPEMDPAAKAWIREYKKLFDEVARFNAGENVASNVQKIKRIGKIVDEDAVDGRPAYAGQKAETANISKLETAERMLKDGADSETVRRETGWFKGYDGKWRFEIDDSDARITTPHSRYTKLSAILQHDKLFAAYPELKEIYVTMDDIENGKGSYSRTLGDITISRDLLDKPESFKKVLIHEVQHAIQDIEQFERGASVEFWDKKLKEGYDSRQDFAKNKEKSLLEQMKEIRMNDKEFLDDMELLETFKPNHPRGKIDWDTLEQIEEDSPAWKNYDRRRDALEEKYGADKVFKFLSLSSALERVRHEGERYAQDLYLDTAGEIEARDVANRLDMTEEQRKNTRPNIDDKDVVFADGSNVSYFAKTSDEDSTKKQLKDHLDEINAMEPVAKINYEVVNKEKAKKDAATLFTKAGSKIDRQNFGIIELSEKELGESSNYLNTSAEFAAWMTIPKVLKRGKLISGHVDHKGGGFSTYTIAAPVVINGKRGNVAAVVKKTGKYRYKVHRILMPDGSRFVYEDIKNNAEPTGSDIASKTGKGPDISSAFESSISQNSQNSNAFDKKSAKDFKNAQFDIIQNTNPMWDEYHTGIRSVEDIRTWDEVLKLNDESEGQFFWGDFSRAEAEQALKDGKITVYSSYPIKDGVFVSTSYVQAQEYAGGRNDKVYSKTVPLTEVAWINGDEGQYAKVVRTDNGGRSALEDGNKATTSDVAAAKRAIREDGIDPSGIIELADKYFDRYNGKLTRTGVRYEFLAAAETMLDSREGALDRAYQKIEALAEELTYNEKASGALAEELADVKRHIKEITFAVKDQDKGEFDSYGGFGEFRKQHFGKIKIANEGTSVDSSYGELQNLYGTNLFPDRNTAQEMLIRIAEVVDMDPTVQTETDADLEMISNETAVAITGELAAAFDKKLAAKGEKLSKTDAEAYKDRIRAREEARAAKAIAKAKKRFEKLEKQIREKAEKYASDVEAKANKTIETERTKLKAEYETDRVFSQAEVNKSLSTVETFKSLPKKVRDDISGQVWMAFSESNGYDSRKWLELKYTAELTDRIIRERDVAVTKYERDAIFEQVNAAMKQIAEGGKKSVRASMEGEIRNEITPKIKEEESTRRVVLSEIYQSLKKIDDVKTQRFAAASDYKGTDFKGTLNRLTQIDWRGQVNDTKVRNEMKKLLDWYNPGNPMLKGIKVDNSDPSKLFAEITTPYNETIQNNLEMLADSEGELTNTELNMLSDTLSYFVKLITEYDQVYIEGKWQSGEDLVYKMRDTIEKQDKMRMPLAIKGLRNRFWSGDFKAFGDPLSIMKAADMYEDGIFTRTYNDWMWGEINAQAEELSIKQEYDEFMKKNKKYLAGADKATVKLHDVEFNRLQLISYIMTLKRKGSWLGVLHEGVVFRDKDGRDVKMRALTPIAEGDGFNKKLQNAIEAERALAESLLTDKDRQYLEILERGFEKAKATKAAADMQRLGFVNVVDGYYYPIRRAYTEHLTEYEAELFATDRYANASFNKKSIEKAKSALLISSADAVFNSHVKGVSRYMYLSPVLDSFNKLYKLKVLTVKPGMGADIGALYATMDSTTSMQQTIAQAKSTWRQDGKIVGFDYLQNLMLDTMSSKPKAIGDDITGWFRSNYVGFALGANPKVLLTQFSSLFASTSVLNVGSHIGGIFTNAKGVDTYSVVARLRDSDYTIAKAMSVSDNVSRLSKWFTQGMSFFDRLVVKRAYAAAKVQVSREQGLKIGTEENSIAAGHLLDKVILETQQNAMSSRKTEAARRGNMLAKTMIMFKSDAITTMGRVIDAWGEYQYLLAKKKDADGDSKGEYDGQLENARKQIYRTAGAVVAGSIYMVIVSEAFKKFYGKDDEDEKGGEKALRRLGEFALNVIGGIPVFSSIIEACTSFSGLESIEFSAINDILTTANKLKDVIGDMADGKADNRDKLRAIERTLFTLGQLTGIPARNIKNFMYAITRLISPEAAYKWNNALYDQSYASNLADALEKGDYDMAEVILELAFGDKMGSGLSDEAIKELMRLAKLGESVVPGAIGDTVTVDGVEREITGKELKAIREKYGEAVDQINKFLKTDLYKSFDDEQKADSVRKIYSLYKNLAYDEVLGTEKDRDMHILSKVLDMDSLVALEAVSIFSSDKDEEGETIDGSRREKILEAILNLDISDEDKLLMIGASGYTLNNGDIPGMSGYAASEMLYNYISELDGISEEERLRIYDICGFKVKNEGAIPDTPTNGDFEYELDGGDVENATDIFNKVVLDKLGQSFKESTSGEIIRLAQIGDKFADKVMPSAISDKVTINGEERELTKEEYAFIKEKYGESVQRIDTFLESDLYKSYTDEQKASAIAKIYDLYKNLAYDSTLGTEKDKEALILYGVVDPDVLCAWETMSVLESDKDADGNTIAGSKRKKIVEAINNLDASDEEKLLLIAMKGYSLKDGDVSGLTEYQADVKLYNHILSLDLSEEERIVLFKAAGFDVKNGEVQKPSASGSSSSGSSSSKRTSSSSKSSSGGSLTNPSGPLSRVTRNRVRRIGKIV